MLRRYTATYDAEKAAQAHASFSPADRLKGRLINGSREPSSILMSHSASTPDGTINMTRDQSDAGLGES
jgi:hypothetical protein